MTNKLIVIDLDETLLTAEKHYDRERFQRVKQVLNDENSILCVATGNSYHKIPDYFDEGEIKDIYFACDNGNFIIKNDEVLHECSISKDIMKQIIQFLDEFDEFHPVISTGKVAYFRESSGPSYDFVAKFNNNLQVIDSFTQIPEDEEILKIAIYSDDTLEQNKVVVRILANRFEDIVAVTSGDKWIDIYHQDGGKGSAVAWLQGKYDIKYEDTIVFGDSLNDESMMDKAEYGVAMGNADKDLLHSAKYQIGTNHDQAVIQILEEYLQTGNFEFMEKYLIRS